MTALSAPATEAHLSRRSFLAGAGALLGSALLLGPNGLPRPGALARLARMDLPRLSLGYVEGSAGLTHAEAVALLAHAGTRVVPAASLRAGDRNLAGGTVSVRLDGFTAARAGTEAAQLDALVSPPAGGGSEPLPFYAWTRGAAGGSSRSAAFATAVAAEPSLGLALRVGRQGAWREAVAVLTGGREHGLPKLRRGLYLVGLDPDAWARPRTPAEAASTPASLALSVHAA